MVDAPSAWPLAWPPNRPRTKVRRPGGFGTTQRNPLDSLTRHRPKPLTMYEARQRLQSQLDLLRASLPVLSSNVELRLDGEPRSGRPEPADPGAALYFRLKDKPIVLACDSFTSVAQNIAAIAAHIDAMRRMERYGVATTDQMFTGFLALPAPMVVDDWREALGNPATLAQAESNYRYSMKGAHPDTPAGSHKAAAKLNAAITRAREVLA